MNIQILDAPLKTKDRIKGVMYMYKNEKRIWLGYAWGCEHGKEKCKCVECKGSQMCEHGTRKRICKMCNGSNICEHKKVKNICVECGGSQICEHKKNRNICIDCKGSQICEHDKLKRICKDCFGISLCSHKRLKSQCKECNGTQICIHSKRKYICKECNGSQLCKHIKHKGSCNICDIISHPHNFCSLCKTIYVKSSPYKPYCYRCYCYLNPENIPTRFMLKENYIDEFLKLNFDNLTIIHNRKIIDGCSLYRPDWIIDFGTYIIIIECDEDSHRSYSCENKRVMTMFQDAGLRPTIIIRFNPDKYKDKFCFGFDEKNQIIINEDEWSIRSNILKEKIEYYSNNIPEKELIVVLLLFILSVILFLLSISIILVLLEFDSL